MPYHNGAKFGKVARFDLAGFSNVAVLNLMDFDPEMVGFRATTADRTRDVH